MRHVHKNGLISYLGRGDGPRGFQNHNARLARLAKVGYYSSGECEK